MYRIALARSGYFFVQRRLAYGWHRVGPFYISRKRARAAARDLKCYGRIPNYTNVVEYV